MPVLHLDRQTDIAWIGRYLADGGVVACAAEGVWGLSCDPFCADAVAAIAQMKSRSAAKGYILVSGERDHFADSLAQLDQRQLDVLARHWPGDSCVFPDPQCLYPAWVAAPATTGQSVCLRLTRHPQLTILSRLLNGPVVSTSANPSGDSPALSIQQVWQYFGDGLVCVAGDIHPECRGKSSQIIQLDTEDRIR